MGYAHRVLRVTLIGGMYNGAEEWSTGFFMGAPDADANDPTEAGAQAVADAWATFFHGGPARISNRWYTESVKLSIMKQDGKTDLGAIVRHDYTDKPYGAATVIGFPPQITLAATLQAGTGKGLAGKGRMYIPGTALSLDETGHADSAQVGELATAMAAFLTACSSSIELPASVINASQGRKNLIDGGPVSRAVDAVRVGNVFDTQRRRRNGLAEQYTTKPVTV